MNSFLVFPTAFVAMLISSLIACSSDSSNDEVCQEAIPVLVECIQGISKQRLEEEFAECTGDNPAIAKCTVDFPKEACEYFKVAFVASGEKEPTNAFTQCADNAGVELVQTTIDVQPQ